MGDNRPESGDSRFFGPQPIESVRGRAFWTYWPLSRFGDLD
jgi:signal peptidase I